MLLGKWTKTTDPGGVGGGGGCKKKKKKKRTHMFTHKLHPVESLSPVSTTESHTVLDDNANTDVPLCQFT